MIYIYSISWVSVKAGLWSQDRGLDCGLDYGLASCSFHAVLCHPVEITYTIVSSQITLNGSEDNITCTNSYWLAM